MPDTSAKVETHYQVLGVHRESTSEEVHKAWRALAAEHHPDRFPERAPRAVRINQAYAQLKTKGGQKLYDDLLHLVHDDCAKCKGKGVLKRQKGMAKITTGCPECYGSGVIV